MEVQCQGDQEAEQSGVYRQDIYKISVDYMLYPYYTQKTVLCVIYICMWIEKGVDQRIYGLKNTLFFILLADTTSIPMAHIISSKKKQSIVSQVTLRPIGLRHTGGHPHGPVNSLAPHTLQNETQRCSLTSTQESFKTHDNLRKETITFKT